MKKNIVCFFTALRFLTILPVAWQSDKDKEFYQESVKFFCIIGIFVGFAGFVLAKILSPYLPQPVLSCVLLFYLAVISGFLHLDGFADSMDGFFSYRPREKILSIMHDSRTGAMGVICIFFLLLFKYATLSTIPLQYLPAVIFFMPGAGRCAIVVTMYMLPYARKEEGLGKLFYPEKRRVIPISALLFFLVSGLFIHGKMAIVAIVALFFTTFLFGIWCKNKIGGATGDTLGAACELTETIVAIFLAVFLNS